MRKREREIRQLAVDAGLKLVDLTMNGNQHYALTVKRDDGQRKKFIMSNSPSDMRGELNKRSDLRRFAREAATAA